MSDIIGSGVAFPLGVDRRGGLALARGDEDVRQAIELILGTAPGERPMRPEFGCRIHHYVFASADATTAGMIAYEVRQSLRRWEPRIEVDDVDVGFDEHDTVLVYIDIRYRIRSSKDYWNLILLIYYIPY